MIIDRFEYTEDDIRFYHLCNTLGKFSTCKDKQVGAVLLDRNLKIAAVGYNDVLKCNNLCNKTCHVKHAEIYALQHLDLNVRPYRSYINLFPCLNCQEEMSKAGIQEVYVFGSQGNKAYHVLANLNIYLFPNLPKLLMEYNGPRNTRAVVQGECAELITAISNYDAREDREEDKNTQRIEIVKEFVDVRLQGYTLQESMPMHELIKEETLKWNKLIVKFKPKFFPDKDLC